MKLLFWFAEPSLCFSHSPGSMFIADISVDEYFKLHKPQHGDEQPRLITLTYQPYLASVCSDTALMKVEDLAKISADPSNTGSTEDVVVTSEFLKSAVRLSHAPSVVINVWLIFLFEFTYVYPFLKLKYFVELSKKHEGRKNSAFLSIPLFLRSVKMQLIFRKTIY